MIPEEPYLASRVTGVRWSAGRSRRIECHDHWVEKKKKASSRTPARSSCANQVAKRPWQKKASLRLTELSPSVWSVGGIWKRLAWRVFFVFFLHLLFSRFLFSGGWGWGGCGEVGWCVWGDPLPCLFVRVSRGRRKRLRSLGTESGAYANNRR